jgi:hypothetical protein
MVRFVLLPSRHRFGEAELTERTSQRALELAPQLFAIERGSGLRAMRVHRLALDELALDGVERRELVVPLLERPHVALDPEQRAEKILEMRAPARSAASIPPCAPARPAPRARR